MNRSLQHTHTQRAQDVPPKAVLLVHNTTSGVSDTSESIERGVQRLTALGWDVVPLELSAEVPPDAQLSRALKQYPHIHTVVVAGGDGTINAAVQVLQGTAYRLAIVPVGTFNHFARHLGTPLQPEDALVLIADATPELVDVAAVNGRYFVNMSIVGIYTRIISAREQYRKRGLKKKSAFALAFVRELVRYRPLRVQLESGGTRITRKTPLLFVGNATFTFGGMDFLESRERLTEGKLQIGIAHARGVWGLLALLVQVWAGFARASHLFDTIGLTELTIHVRRSRVAVGVDGEIVYMTPPLYYTVHPRALWVLRA